MASPRLPPEIVYRICRALCEPPKSSPGASPHSLYSKHYRSTAQQRDLASAALVDRTWRMGAQPIFDEYLLLIDARSRTMMEKMAQFLASFPAERRGRTRCLRLAAPLVDNVPTLYKSIETAFRCLPALRSLVIGSAKVRAFAKDTFWPDVLAKAPPTLRSLTFLHAVYLGSDLGIPDEIMSELEELHIHGCPHLHPALIWDVMFCCPSLHTLEITECALDTRVAGTSKRSYWVNPEGPTLCSLKHLRFGIRWEDKSTKRWALHALSALFRLCAPHLRSLVLEGLDCFQYLAQACLRADPRAFSSLESLTLNTSRSGLIHCLKALETGRFARLRHLCAPDYPSFYLQILRVAVDGPCPALPGITLLKTYCSNRTALTLLQDALQRAGSPFALQLKEPGRCGVSPLLACFTSTMPADTAGQLMTTLF